MEHVEKQCAGKTTTWLELIILTDDAQFMRPRIKLSSQESMHAADAPLPLLLNAPSSATNALMHSLPSGCNTQPANTNSTRAWSSISSRTLALVSANRKHRRSTRQAVDLSPADSAVPWARVSKWMLTAVSHDNAVLDRIAALGLIPPAAEQTGVGELEQATDATAFLRNRVASERADLLPLKSIAPKSTLVQTSLHFEIPFNSLILLPDIDASKSKSGMLSKLRWLTGAALRAHLIHHKFVTFSDDTSVF
jgi:hypothetical protein